MIKFILFPWIIYSERYSNRVNHWYKLSKCPACCKIEAEFVKIFFILNYFHGAKYICAIFQHLFFLFLIIMFFTFFYILYFCMYHCLTNNIENSFGAVKHNTKHDNSVFLSCFIDNFASAWPFSFKIYLKIKIKKE
jgi:hypothetical protein